MENRKIKPHFLFYLITGLLVAVIFGAVTYHQLTAGDFQPHLAWARKLGESGYLWLRANILFQRSVLVVRDVLPFNFFARVSPLLKQIIDIKSYDISAFIVMLFAYIATFITLFHYFKNSLTLEGSRNKVLVLLTAIALLPMLVGPITLFTYPERQYMGYITGNPYHNPTYLLMKPFALMIFILICDNLFKRRNWWVILVSSIVFVLATLAKPSFTLSILPSIVFTLIVFRLKEWKKISPSYFLIVVVLVPVIVMLSQYIIMYTGQRGDRVLLSPFEAILNYVPGIGSELLFALASIVFPLTTTILYWKKIVRDFSMQLVWVNFGASMLLAYLFTEQTDMLSLNFWWTAMMAVFLLFVVNIKFFVQEVIQSKRDGKIFTLKTLLPGVLLSVHFLCGILFYISSLSCMELVK